MLVLISKSVLINSMYLNLAVDELVPTAKFLSCPMKHNAGVIIGVQKLSSNYPLIVWYYLINVIF